VLTERLEVRLARVDDRARFVELFCDEDFMVFSSGTLTAEAASKRFDQMLPRCEEFPFAKQPVVERSSGIVVGYCGVDWLDFEGAHRLEFGYRLTPEARGKGYATEASTALLAVADQMFRGELLAVIHPTNTASIRAADKLGFAFWRADHAPVQVPHPISVGASVECLANGFCENPVAFG
jgi:RimJ/RimL family protein N-acetyltransferase